MWNGVALLNAFGPCQMVRRNLGKQSLMCMLLDVQAFLRRLAHSHCRRQIEYGYGLRFVSYTDVGSKDPSPSLCNVKSVLRTDNVAIGFRIWIQVSESVQCEMFGTLQYSDWVWNLNPSLYPSPKSVSVNVNEPLGTVTGKIKMVGVQESSGTVNYYL